MIFGMRGCLRGTGVLLLMALLSPRGAAADSTEIDIAKAHFQTGQIYYNAKRYPEAAREFEEAYRLSHLSAFLYNMGRSYDHVGDPARALDAYRRYLVAPTSETDAAEVRARILALEHLVARVKVVASVAGARVDLDGNRLGGAPIERIEVGAGTHRLEIGAEGYATWREKLIVSADEDRVVTANLVSLVRVVRVADKVPVYKRWWPWTILAGVVVVAGVTGGVLGARAAQSAQVPEARLPDVRSP
jgi:hypothetical protein